MTLTLDEVGVVSSMERHLLMEGRLLKVVVVVAVGRAVVLAAAGGWMGADSRLEKPTMDCCSFWLGTSSMRSMSRASSSSPLHRDENFLKGLRRSSEEDAVDETGVDVVEEKTVVRAATGFTGDTIVWGLAGDRSRFSLRGAQLTGTLKQSSSSFLPLSEYPLSCELVSKSSGGDGLWGELKTLFEGDTSCSGETKTKISTSRMPQPYQFSLQHCTYTNLSLTTPPPP